MCRDVHQPMNCSVQNNLRTYLQSWQIGVLLLADPGEEHFPGYSTTAAPWRNLCDSQHPQQVLGWKSQGDRDHKPMWQCHKWATVTTECCSSIGVDQNAQSEKAWPTARLALQAPVVLSSDLGIFSSFSSLSLWIVLSRSPVGWVPESSRALPQFPSQ